MALEEWERKLLEEAHKIMISGGELTFVVQKRENERKPEIYTYPENKISLKEISLID